ncbi:MAG: histidine kinase [Sulfurovum sp. AS07-7]|nr:MAG: histidine kinase [Sulfurovum sp. AS07-7]
MKNLSVTSFIHILFSLAIAIAISTVFIFLSWNKNKIKIDEMYHHKLIADAFLSNIELDMTDAELDKLYDKFNVKNVDLLKAKQEIEELGTTIFSGESPIGTIKIFDTPSGHYIYIQRLGFNLMLKDNRPKNYVSTIALGLSVVIIGILILLYYAILKKLKPLKKLHQDIEEFAHGNLKKRIRYKNDDEIGKIAKSFDNAIVRINDLSDSKNLFMRNIMHELKTPITKGRILTESIDDENTKNMLVRSFDRMNELIDELATIEKLTAQNFQPHFEMTTIDNVIKIGQNLLLNDKECVIENIDNRPIYTDIKLLSLAIKNLLDNGIKYSIDKKVKLLTTPEAIEIISKGEELKHPLSFYTEPFSQGEKRNSGFGLGLYIVKNILEKINLKLKYRHENGQNIFIIELV